MHSEACNLKKFYVTYLIQLTLFLCFLFELIYCDTYNNEQYKIYKIVEGVRIHDVVHDIHPSLQRDDLWWRNREGDVVSMNRKLGANMAL